MRQPILFLRQRGSRGGEGTTEVATVRKAPGTLLPLPPITSGGRDVREQNSARWDGMDGAGEPVPSEAYLHVLESGGARVVRRLVRIR